MLFAESALPQNVRNAMTAMSAMMRASAARTRIVLDAFATLPGLLADVPFIVLKGCDFATRLYPSPELRPMADIDVLVRESDFERACALLKARGAVRQRPATAVARSRSHHEAAFSVGNVTLEPHQRFAQRWRHRIDYDALWRRAEPFRFRDVDALRLSDADAFVYETLSISLKYFESPLIRFVDLWLMLQKKEELLEQGAEVAREWRARHVYYSVLRYGGAIFPEFRGERFDRVLRALLPRNRRDFLDRRVIPPPSRGEKHAPRRGAQLWQKFWLLDDMRSRLGLAASHAAGTISGSLRE